MSQFVYFIRPVGADGPVKIGCSKLPLERLKSLSTWSPTPLEIVAQFPGGFDLERNIHQCLADLHSHHEWFRSDPRITAIIDKLQAGASIFEAMDLSARIATISRKALHWSQHPENRERTSFTMKLSWACRKLDKGPAWFTLPDRAENIMIRWRGFARGYRAAPITPTAEEMAYLREVIANPAQHLIAHGRQRLAA